MTAFDAEYWEQRHAASDTPWCLRMPSPPLSAYFDQVTDKDVSVLIPGAGHYHDALYLLNKGFTDITVCDISSTAIENIKKHIGPHSEVKYLQGDFFDIRDTFHYIAEQTFFCALHPSMREAYVRKTDQLLKPGGTWIGVLFARHFEQEGPPFGGDQNEYKTLFHKYLEIKNISMCYNSAKPRQDSELFMICKKR